MNVTELAKVKDGMLVSDFQGKVEKVFKQEDFSYVWKGKTISGKKQNLAIGGALFEIKDREPLGNDLVGKEIEILSTLNEKRQQWFGMKKSTYKDKSGKTVIKVSVTPSANIQISGADEIEQQEPQKVVKKDDVKPTSNVVPQSVWDKKELLIARQACLKVAAEFAKGRDNIKSPTEITEIAEIFLKYVYGKYEAGEPDDFKDVQEMESAEKCEIQEEVPF